ncbi:MAG TPA: hypothetical protein VG435_12640 [Acidimicrobiales bacterium]|jgi:hypothetical protein|nr:hypothetical protein [Acidimicrobiales bacterium]
MTIEAPYIDPGPRCGPPDTVVLDIGGDVGALILYASAECAGREVDLTPVGADRSHHVHTMIRRRRLATRDVFAGVYPELTQGRYTVWGTDAPLGDVEVVGGRVAEFDVGDLAG